MKHSTKRLISMLICLAMALAILPVAAFAADTTRVYCQAPNGWSTCYIHYWGNGETSWPGEEMAADEDGIWYYDVPNGVAGIIFNNGSGTQTSDMSLPTDDKVMYVFANSYWTTYGKVEVVAEYFVAGTSSLCGVEWTPNAIENKMTESDGIYSITYTGVAAGSYEFKVTNGSWASCWGEAGTSNNYVLTVDSDNSTVVISFDPVTELVNAVVNPEEEPTPDGEDTLIAEKTVTFATAEDAWNAEVLVFIPAADGNVTIDVSACDPGFFVDVYADSDWVVEYYETDPKTIVIPVSAGVTYEFIISSAVVEFEGMCSPGAGSVTYKVTADVAAGEANDDDDSGDVGDNSESNPLFITSPYGIYLEPGQTVWFGYDNYEHMMADGVYSQMLNISAGVSYAVTYRETDVPVDAEGFVSYEMIDMMYTGMYVFSVTNNGSVRAFFSIEVKDRPAYIVSEYTLALGDNVVIPDTDYAKTLYEFIPEQTGVYKFTISEGFIGNWGSPFNPIDNTGTQDSTLQWTCTAEGQSVMIGVAETEEAIISIERIGEYVPEEQVDLTVYTNTYGFTYQMPENPELIAIDVLDDKADVAVLDQNGFYRYGSANGPLMVIDLNEFPVNLADAYINGQLRAYIYDANGKLIARYDYNEAMNEYLEAGLVPVTEELATMLKQVGEHHNWWDPNGFVFEAEAPEDSSIAWMTACSYIKGSEITGGNTGSNTGNNSGNNSGNNGGNTGSNPKTSDISMAWAVIAIAVAGTCLVILKKKETYFCN